MNEASSTRLAFDQVVLPSANRLGGSPLSFSLEPGQVLWLDSAPEDVERVGDVLLGLEEPEAGQVLIRGRDWMDLNADAQADQRASVRRIFSHKGWISHMDMEENFILARDHHGDGTPETLLEESRTLCLELGLDFPVGFPEALHPRQLHPMQWVRALSGPADLLVIGYRFELFPPGLDEKLAEILARRIQAGLSVIWLGRKVPDRLWGVPDPAVCVKLSLK